MGLIYSVMQYFSYGQTQRIPVQSIKNSSKSLSQGLKLRMNKLTRNNYELQKQFIQLINKQKRDLFIQNVKIDDMILASIKYGVYEQLCYCAQKIFNEADNISKNLSQVSDQCLRAIFSIVHLYGDFELSDLIDLKQFIPEPYPVINEDKLAVNIKRFINYKKPTQYERNLYVIQMIKRHNGLVSIAKLNEVNHAFAQNPIIPQNEIPINSNELYGRSASCVIQQQNYDNNKYKKQQYNQYDDFAA